MELFIISLLCYLIGSIPFGFLLTKIFLNKDIRNIGSGNIGATNALRTGNKKIGFSTLILDILKAAITIIFVKFNYSEFIFISTLSTASIISPVITSASGHPIVVSVILISQYPPLKTFTS